jgi:hypothetical protein
MPEDWMSGAFLLSDKCSFSLAISVAAEIF